MEFTSDNPRDPPASCPGPVHFNRALRSPELPLRNLRTQLEPGSGGRGPGLPAPARAALFSSSHRVMLLSRGAPLLRL